MEYHVTYRRLAVAFIIQVQMLTALRGDSRCSTDLDTCPPGHQVSVCSSGSEFGLFCEKCSDKTFQPDVNKNGDRCRFRKSCRRQFMRFRDIGSPIRDADCTCKPGYHFENEDQRACVPNTKCDIGHGQGNYGICENCYQKGGFSDVFDRVQKCQKLSKCSSQGRCLVKPSDGTTDNQCSSIVEDISQCDAPPASSGTNEGIIIGCVLGLLVVVIAVFAVFLYKRTYKRRNKSWMSGEKTDDVIRALMEMSRKDAAFTTNGETQKEATRGYLDEWRQWKGDNPESIAILFQCLRKCDRDDIVESICKQFRQHPDLELSHQPIGADGDLSPKYNLCPCKKTPAKPAGMDEAPTEETKPLRCAPEVVIQYPDLTGPSAPLTADSYDISRSISNLTFPVQVTTS